MKSSCRNLSDEETNNIKQIIDKIKKDKNAYAFLNPVPHKELNLHDYIKFIRKPMDLSTVQNKLNNFKYSSVVEVFDDIQLIWDNCKKFNMENSFIYNQAEALEKLTDALISQIYSLPHKKRLNDPNYNVNEKEYNDPPILYPGQISIQDKIDIKNKFKSLDNKKLNQMTKFVSETIPEIINANDDSIQIDFQKLDNNILQMIKQFLKKIDSEDKKEKELCINKFPIDESKDGSNDIIMEVGPEKN